MLNVDGIKYQTKKLFLNWSRNSSLKKNKANVIRVIRKLEYVNDECIKDHTELLFFFSTGQIVRNIRVRLGILGRLESDITSVHEQFFDTTTVNLA